MGTKKVVSLIVCVSLILANTAFSSLVGWWRLDEGGGTVAIDSSGNGNHGTLGGKATRTTGRYGNGVYMDGTEAYVEIPGSVLGPAGTLAFWFKPDWSGSSPSDYRLFDASYGTIYFFIGKGSTDTNMGPENFGFYFEDVTDADFQNVEIPAAGNIQAGTWYHVAVTWQYNGGTAVFYFNGEQRATATGLGGFPSLHPNPRFGYKTIDYIGMTNGAASVIDDIKVFDTALPADQIPPLMQGAAAELASSPVPGDRATDVPRDTTLSWTPGMYPGTHDVYLGTSLEDVNTATRSDPKGVLVSKGQTSSTFKPSTLLSYGQQYYWRVDEVNSTPDATIHKGYVWTFVVEPLSYPVTPIAATASSIYRSTAAVNTGPEKTIDGSGMKGDQHGTGTSEMWISRPGLTPIWIQYEFDKVYKLDKVWVWNSNQAMEALIGWGAKDVEILYSEDGQTWNSLGMFEF
ncbi:MAG: hypothetical protein QHH07_12185, partial [Sedimentisphaerales bacterium]|nr:hypothetical protein [Sedimentisphaerales bacterium]